MPRVIEKFVYKYNELSEKAKERVREWYVSSGMDYDWYGFTIDDLKSQGVEKGLDVDEINFSGFYSQGSYASWNGSIRLLDFLDAHLTPDDTDYARYLILRDLIDDAVALANSGDAGFWDAEKTSEVIAGRAAIAALTAWRDAQ